MRPIMILAALATAAAASSVCAQTPDRNSQCQGPDGKFATAAECKGAGPAPAVTSVYRLDAKGRPTEQKLLSRDIVQTSAIEQGTLSFDLSADKLILDEDFFLALEWVGGGTATKVHNGLAFSAGIGYANNDIYLREVSQDNWERASVGAVLAGMQPKLAFYVTVQD